MGSKMELSTEASVSKFSSSHTTLVLCSGRGHIGLLLFLPLINLPSICLRFPVVLCERLRLSPVDIFKSCAASSSPPLPSRPPRPPAGPLRPSNIRLWLALTNGAWRSNNPGAFPCAVPAALTCESPGVPVNLFDLWPPLCASQTTNKCSCDGGAPGRFSPTDSSGDWLGPRLLSANKEWVRRSDYYKCFWLVLSMNVLLRRALFMLQSKTGRTEIYYKQTVLLNCALIVGVKR